MTFTPSQTHRLAHQFGQAITSGNRNALEELLQPGEYQMQNEELDTVIGSKDEFIDWMMTRRTDYLTVEPLTYRIEFCTECIMGGHVVLFNEGRFPYMSWISNSWSFVGFGFSEYAIRIDELHFCMGFRNADRRGFLGRNMDEIMERKGRGIDELYSAYRFFKRETGVEHPQAALSSCFLESESKENPKPLPEDHPMLVEARNYWEAKKKSSQAARKLLDDWNRDD